MLNKYFSSLFVLTSVVCCELLGVSQSHSPVHPSTKVCGKGPSPVRASVRHIEGNGIGYNQGYTTLEGFFAPLNLWREVWLPFVDIRGHLFNNGRPAANLGIGTRYLGISRVWGVNAYYDYRKTNHQHYNQASLGFESLGRIWDFRVNGYLPVGAKTSGFYDTRFQEFKDHYMVLSRKKEFALKGCNAEAGVHVDKYQNFPFYFAAGPYFLNGQGKSAWGGQVRAVVELFKYVQLEGNTSYDHLFHWIGQGQISLVIPFGGKRQVNRRKDSYCSREQALSHRAQQRVDRAEIIPVDSKHKHSRAINPATGQPYFFWFVENTSSSAGTFESPFPTLAQAQGAASPFDVIYVFPGDGTTKGMDLGFVMQDNQKLWGAGIPYTVATSLGEINLPAQANTLPLITNTTLNTPAVTLANSCEIAGLHIRGTNGGAGILGGDPTFVGSGITNTLIYRNQITDGQIATAQQAAIFLANCQGELVVHSNLVASITGSGIQVENQNSVSPTLIVSKNTVRNTANTGIYVSYGAPTGHLSLLIEKNIVSGNESHGITLENIGTGSEATICGRIIGNNIFDNLANPGTVGLNIFQQNTTSAAQMQLEISLNASTHNNGFGVSIDADSGNICTGLTNNISQNNFGNADYELDVGSGALQIENLENVNQVNTGVFQIQPSVTSIQSGGCNCQ